MSILWISLVLLNSIIFVVPAEAFPLANCPYTTQQMAETTKNPNELASDALDAYNTELNQIISGKTFEEIIQEINYRTEGCPES